MASKTVEKAAPALPALAPTPALEIGHEDVALPRIKVGQFQSKQVQEELVAAGCLFASSGADDPEPDVLYKHGDDQGLLFHVLAMRKGKSVTVEGELYTFAFDDPSAPADAWVTYNYVLCLPEHDDQTPYKFLMTRTASPAAKQINAVLLRNQGRGPAHALAFRVETAKKENDKGRFFVPRVRPVEAQAAHIAAADSLAAMIAGTTADVQATGVEPAI